MRAALNQTQLNCNNIVGPRQYQLGSAAGGPAGGGVAISHNQVAICCVSDYDRPTMKPALSAPPPAQALRSLLRGKDLRATASRLAVLQYLQAQSAPISHAELVLGLAGKGFDRATVYRNLIDLSRVGLVSRADLGDHVWRFELTAGRHQASDSAHPHFVCTSCGDISCLPDAGIAIRGSGKVPRSVRSSSYEVQLRGVCDSC